MDLAQATLPGQSRCVLKRLQGGSEAGATSTARLVRGMTASISHLSSGWAAPLIFELKPWRLRRITAWEHDAECRTFARRRFEFEACVEQLTQPLDD